MQNKAVRMEVRMTAEEKERLYRYAEKEGMTISDIVRRSVDTYIKQRNKKAKYLSQKDT